METKRDGYYDFPAVLEEILFKNCCIDDFFYLRDLQQRKLLLKTEISEEMVNDAVRHILQYNKEDQGKPTEERQPILLYLSSEGGDLDAGFELIDTILNSKTPVYTINLGYQYSMGFMIGLAGHKRFASKNAKFLMHDGNNLIYDSGMKAQDRMKFQTRVEDRIKEYILSRSKLTAEEYDKNVRVEWYMFADEAKEKGFTDYIIGVDCDIDEVV